jgi:hypothetical protein
MESKIKDLEGIISKLEESDYKSYFFLPDFEKPSGGIRLTYDHVKCMNENGFNGVIIHQKKDFFPAWLGESYKGIPTIYLEEVQESLKLNMEDFFFIPEGFPQLMEMLQKQGAPCKKVVFCQNWYYILNALSPGVSWDHYGVKDCLSVSNIQTNYIKMIMPNIRTKNVVGKVDPEQYKPVADTKKLPIVSFIPSRFDGGQKSHNVIKTFYAMFPQYRWIQFKQITGLSNNEYEETLANSAFYIHFDEYSSWGTAPIEAYLSNCLVAGWDGIGGREYMTKNNTWIAPNGDIIRLAIQLSNMIETYLMDEVSHETIEDMEKATLMYSPDAERDSVINVHNEYREDRINELTNAIKMIGGEK